MENRQICIPYNSFKEKGFSRKMSASYAFLRFINISRLHIGMCQLEKPSANEITEPLAFTVCKLKLRGKAIVTQSRPRQDFAPYLDEIPWFSSFLVLSLFCFLSKDFSPFWSVS